MESEVVLEVAAGPQSAQSKHGFSPYQAPARAGQIHSVFDQMAACALDNPCPDREADIQVQVVLQVLTVAQQVASALVHRLTLGSTNGPQSSATAHPSRYVARFALQDPKTALLHPLLGFGPGTAGI